MYICYVLLRQSELCQKNMWERDGNGTIMLQETICEKTLQKTPKLTASSSPVLRIWIWLMIIVNSGLHWYTVKCLTFSWCCCVLQLMVSVVLTGLCSPFGDIYLSSKIWNQPFGQSPGIITSTVYQEDNLL